MNIYYSKPNNNQKGKYMNIQELVMAIRIKCDISQQTLAKWAKIDQTSISLYETGKRTAMTLRRKQRLVDIANKKCSMKLKVTDIK